MFKGILECIVKWESKFIIYQLIDTAMLINHFPPSTMFFDAEIVLILAGNI